MNIVDARTTKLGGEDLTAELRIAAGAGDRADVNQPLDLVRVEQFEEFLPSSIRVADGVDGSHLGNSFERIKLSGFWHPTQTDPVEGSKTPFDSLRRHSAKTQTDVPRREQRAFNLKLRRFCGGLPVGDCLREMNEVELDVELQWRFGSAQEKIAAGIEIVEEVIHDTRLGCAVEIDEDIATENDVHALQEEYFRIFLKIETMEGDKLLDFGAHLELAIRCLAEMVAHEKIERPPPLESVLTPLYKTTATSSLRPVLSGKTCPRIAASSDAA